MPPLIKLLDEKELTRSLEKMKRAIKDLDKFERTIQKLMKEFKEKA